MIPLRLGTPRYGWRYGSNFKIVNVYRPWYGGTAPEGGGIPRRGEGALAGSNAGELTWVLRSPREAFCRSEKCCLSCDLRHGFTEHGQAFDEGFVSYRQRRRNFYGLPPGAHRREE